MKKLLIIFILTLALAAFGFSVGAEELPTDTAPPPSTEETVEETVDELPEWRIYVEEKVIPTAVLAVSAIATVCVAALPTINKVKAAIALILKAVEKFKSATGDVNTAISNKAETEEKLAQLLTDVEYIKLHLENVEKIERIGFGNMKELVVGGYASEIGKVGDSDENKG